MAKRKTPSYRDSLGRAINPWRDDVIVALEEKCRMLMMQFGIAPDAADAYAQALEALTARHGARSGAATSPRDARRNLIIAASRVVPGFQITIRGPKVTDVYKARHPITKKSALEREQIVSLILAVRSLTTVNAKGRRVGVKRAIQKLTQIGQPLAKFRTAKGVLEELYYGNRRCLPPALPSLTLCSRPNDRSCFGADPFFDEVPDSCRLKGSCKFWKAWEVWANFATAEYVAERRALSGAVHYRRMAPLRLPRRVPVQRSRC